VVTLADERTLHYERLLLATGSIPGRPPIDGIGLAGVHVLRTLAHADALRTGFRPGRRVAIIGAGWIGCEVAAAARAHGAEVTLIEAGGAPLERVLGPQLGAFFARVHRDHGVDVITNATIERIEGGAGVERLRFACGRVVECDLVVVGIGIAPDTRLAQEAGLAIDNGIVADEHLRTSAPDVFAAGDVASAFHPRYGRHVRVEHWANALNQGIAAGRSMLDRGEPYARLPYFFSDQYDTGLEYAGLHDPSDRLVVRGDLDASHLQAFWLGADGRVTAGMHVNEWDAIEPIKQLIERDTIVDPDRLADSGVPLEEVAAAGAR
jgi:3-phenylpropionate/trans-cinnamate dioxygenase ferredoxin reductase component